MATRDIRFCRLNPHSDPVLLGATATCYLEVFADEPWNEWKKCSLCGQKWGVSQALEVADMQEVHCGIGLQDYWPHELVVESMTEEIGPEASCWLAMAEQRVVGFTWGYPMGITELDSHLRLEGAAHSLLQRFGDSALRFAYQDELGVISQYRGQRIASQLVSRRLDDFITAGLKVGVVRTKTTPPTVTYLWYSQIGYEVIAEYGDEDGRVVMARSLAL